MTDTTDTANQSAIETLVTKLTSLWWRAEASIEKFQNSLKMNTKSEQESGTPVARTVTSSPQTDFRGAHGVIMQVETIGKGVAAVLIGGVLLAILLAGMGWQSASAERDRALSAEQAALSREANELTRHEQAEAELRAQLKETNTEARMAEYYILELDGKLMAGGFIPPSRGYGQWKQERKK